MKNGKRLLKPAGVILGINFAAMACLSAVVYFGIVMDNPVAAVFPALLTFLLMFWQPWLPLMLFFTVLHFVLIHAAIESEATFWTCVAAAPFVSALITFVIYQLLLWKNKMGWLPHIKQRLLRRTGTSVAAGVLFAAFLISFAAYTDLIVRHHEPADVSEKYAFPNSRCYYLSWTSPYNNEYLMRVKVSPAQLAQFTKDWTPAEPQDFPLSFWVQPPYWWHPPLIGGEAYQEGFYSHPTVEIFSQSRAVYDPRTETLYVWGWQKD